MERGQEYFAAANYDKARVEFRNALQITPNDAEARFMSGFTAEKLGDLRTAGNMYQATIDVDPEHARARANLGRMLVFAGAPSRALELVEPAIVKHPDDAELLTVRGAARIQLKDKEGALADAEHAVKVAPENANAVALLASLYRQSDQTDRAIELIRQVLEKKPEEVELREVLARLYLGTQPELAQEQFRRIIVSRPQELSYRVQLAMLHARAKQLADAEKVLREAVAALPKSDDAKLAYIEFLIGQGQRARGEQELRQFIGREPKNYALQLGLGAFQQRAGATDVAIGTYRQIIVRDGDGAAGITARNRIASIEVGRGKYDQALQLIGEILKKNPRDNDALVMRGNIALERHDARTAIADLRAVLRDQPGAVGVLRALARAHLENGEASLAEESIRSAMEAAPADVGVRVELAQLLLQTVRGERAVTLLEETVRNAPTNVPAREAMARAYIATNDLSAARTAAEDLKVTAPRVATGPYLAGIVAQAQKRYDDAVAEFTRALELQPNAMDALAALTRIELVRGQRERALTRVQSLVTAEPKNAVARNLLAELQMESKRYDVAAATLGETIKITPAWWLPYRNLALVNLARNDKNAAVAAYQAGIAATQRNPVLVGELATLYERQGLFDDAIKQYESLHTQNPRNDMAANNLAMLLVTYRRDRPSLDRARELTAPFAGSRSAPLLDTHGWVMFKLGQYTDALAVLEKASAQAPDSKVIRYHLAMAQLKSGQSEKARGNLEAALAAPANFVGSDEARTTLASLGGRSG